MKIVVGVSGASGSVYGYRLLEKLRATGSAETHVVLTRTGERTGWLEMGMRAVQWKKLADHFYPVEDLSAPIASGSYPIDAMVVAPCSIHSMSAIATGISGNLLVRAADVTLKERRKLILMIREMPFHLGHLRTMVSLTEMGAIIAPPVPAFYSKPQTVLDIVDSSVERVMDLLGVPSADTKRWTGPGVSGLMTQQRLHAGFQGELGAFSQVAVQQLLGAEAAAVPFQRFDQVFEALTAGHIDAAVIPIENTLHGSVHENYDHLLHFKVDIVAETHVRIAHTLIAPPGLTFERIRRVYSHPVALNQCLRFFAENPQIERVPFYDTAGSVKTIMSELPPDTAAIASAVASEIYGANILQRNLEDDPSNFTRFFLLRRPGESSEVPLTGEWKTSLVFSTPNIPGSLFRSLAAFSLRDIDLAKIESRPLRGTPWEYLFYVDLMGRSDDPKVEKALGHLEEVANFVRVLGCYPKGT